MSVKEFVEFLKKYNVIGLAIAVIIGAKVSDFVGSLVSDLLAPLIFRPALRAAQIDDIRQLSYHSIRYGKVLSSFIDFVIVAFVVYSISKWVLRESEVSKK